jgi:hypothetical protein
LPLAFAVIPAHWARFQGKDPQPDSRSERNEDTFKSMTISSRFVGSNPDPKVVGLGKILMKMLLET